MPECDLIWNIHFYKAFLSLSFWEFYFTWGTLCKNWSGFLKEDKKKKAIILNKVQREHGYSPDAEGKFLPLKSSSTLIFKPWDSTRLVERKKEPHQEHKQETFINIWLLQMLVFFQNTWTPHSAESFTLWGVWRGCLTKRGRLHLGQLIPQRIGLNPSSSPSSSRLLTSASRGSEWWARWLSPPTQIADPDWTVSPGCSLAQLQPLWQGTISSDSFLSVSLSMPHTPSLPVYTPSHKQNKHTYTNLKVNNCQNMILVQFLKM